MKGKFERLANTGLFNYYGGVQIFRIDDDYYLVLEDLEGGSGVKLPKEIGEFFVKYFNTFDLEYIGIDEEMFEKNYDEC